MGHPDYSVKAILEIAEQGRHCAKHVSMFQRINAHNITTELVDERANSDFVTRLDRVNATKRAQRLFALDHGACLLSLINAPPSFPHLPPKSRPDRPLVTSRLSPVKAARPPAPPPAAPEASPQVFLTQHKVRHQSIIHVAEKRAPPPRVATPEAGRLRSESDSSPTPQRAVRRREVEEKTPTAPAVVPQAGAEAEAESEAEAERSSDGSAPRELRKSLRRTRSSATPTPAPSPSPAPEPVTAPG
jgi:hypothetical protein